MKAFGFNKFGGPEKDAIIDIDKPTEASLGPGDLLVKVHAASLNPLDYKVRNGKTLPEFVKLKLPHVHGSDFAGEVIAKADDVGAFEVGDKVFGLVKGQRRGTVTSLFVVDSSVCAKIPENLSYEDAAGIPLVGLTAFQCFKTCGLTPYDDSFSPRILILGGSGGVGTIALQLAKNVFNASFVATTASSGEKTELCKDLGADLVIDYKSDENYSGLGEVDPFDIVFDTRGAVKLGIPFVKEGGRVLSIAVSPTAVAIKKWIKDNKPKNLQTPMKILPNFSLGRSMIESSVGTKKVKKLAAKKKATYYHHLVDGNGEDMKTLSEALEKEVIKPVTDKVFPFDEAKKAMEYLESQHATGKVVILIKHEPEN